MAVVDPVLAGAAEARRPRLARSELRRQLRHVARLRTATLIAIVVALVGAPVGFFVIRDAVRDPIFAELDNWDLPKWATIEHQDESYGSRWCLRECRFRERTWKSSRTAEATHLTYIKALRGDGWVPWQGNGCAGIGVQGYYTCWQRDEYVMDLWVRDEPCEIKPVRPTVDPNHSAAPEGGSAAPQPEPTGIPGPGCGKSRVTVKVFNRVAYQRSG